MSQIQKRPSLLLNGISNWMPLGVNLVIGFFLTPYLIRSLGDEKFGLWTLVTNFLGYYGVLRLGVGAGIMRYVPYYNGQNREHVASEIISTAVANFLVVGFIVAGATVLGASWIAKFFNGGKDFEKLLITISFIFVAECVMRIFDSGLRSHEHWVSANLVTILTSVMRGAGLTACVWLGYGPIEMGYSVLVVTLIETVIIYFLLIKQCPHLVISPSSVKIKRLRMLMRFGLLSTVIMIVGTLRIQGHVIIVGKMISISAVTFYGVASYLAKHMSHAVLAPARVFWPRFAFLDGGDRQKEINSLYIKGTRYIAFFASSIAVVIFVVGPSFINLWVGPEFAGTTMAMMLLTSGYLIETTFSITGMLLSATGRQGANALLTIIEGIVEITLAMLLVGFANQGIAGVAAGFLIASILIRVIVVPIYSCRVLGLPLFYYYTETVLSPVIILGIIVAIAYWINVPAHIHNWLVLVLTSMTTFGIYTILVFGFGFNQEERVKVIGIGMRGLQIINSKTPFIGGIRTPAEPLMETDGAMPTDQSPTFEVGEEN